jgi:hypothetical protein
MLCFRCESTPRTGSARAWLTSEGSLPSCGLGFTTTAMVAARSSSPSDAQAAEREAIAERLVRDRRAAVSRCGFAVSYGDYLPAIAVPSGDTTCQPEMLRPFVSPGAVSAAK